MELAADYLERIARLWSEHYLAGLRQLPENVIPPRRASADAGLICERDPGVANWLAAGGANQGYFMIRWQGLRAPLAVDDPPRAEVAGPSRARPSIQISEAAGPGIFT